MKFRSSVWDPVLILSQMVTMQCLFYLSSGFLILLIGHVLGYPVGLRLLFAHEEVRFRDVSGKSLVAVFLLTSVLCSLGLWRLVKRTKQCLDFACTIHFWHLVFCMAFASSFPVSPAWWLVNIMSVVFMTVLGEFLCMKTELKAIPVGQSRNV